jgi:predicted transcriptional regulator YdeE
MNLIQVPGTVTWPKMHYIYIEKIGPFQETAAPAWQALRANEAHIAPASQITARLSQYRIEPQKMTYRAGVAVSEIPPQLPAGFLATTLGGDSEKYIKFILTGPYSLLPAASGRVWDIVREKQFRLRPAFCLEHYADDPQHTPESDLITEILIPVL